MQACRASACWRWKRDILVWSKISNYKLTGRRVPELYGALFLKQKIKTALIARAVLIDNRN